MIRLRRRIVCVCLLVLVISYSFACVLLLSHLALLNSHVTYQIENRGHSPEQLNLIHQLTKSDCTCNSTRQDSASREQPITIEAVNFNQKTCDLIKDSLNTQNVDIQVSDVYKQAQLSYHHLTFSHRGWIPDFQDLSYSSSQWDDDTLRVFVVPYSHVDPGWIQSSSSYYSRARSTLNLATSHLLDNPQLRFVWSEVVYLNQWYHQQDSTTQDNFRKLLQRGQFEILTGGWVMTDEAVSHYEAMLDQLIEGHQWLKENLNYTVQNAWSIDAFGLSGTMPYFLKSSGINNLLIQRVHYAVKKPLGKNKQLQFLWRQTWDTGSETDLFTHVTPFRLYNILHSCGPDPETCCQFDFTHKNCYKASKYYIPESITKENIKEKAWILLDQLRRKAQLFQHNDILFLYGDDFRFREQKEWTSLLNNLEQLMTYMNADESMHVKLTFSTLGEYFRATRQTISEGPGLSVPTLSGDFLSYTERSDQYWSGFFTTRPIMKHMIRRLQAKIRTADILIALVASYSNGAPSPFSRVLIGELYGNVQQSHQLMGLLHHHDAITGTATKTTVIDYMQKLNVQFNLVSKMSAKAVSFLAQWSSAVKVPTREDLFISADHQGGVLDLPKSTTLRQTENVVAVFNPVGTKREAYITVYVTNPIAQVQDDKGHNLLCQISPVWKQNTAVVDVNYRLTFLTNLEPFEIRRFKINLSSNLENKCTISKVKITSVVHKHDHKSAFDITWRGIQDFSLKTPLLKVHFCGCTGLIQSVTTLDNLVQHKSEINFVKYGTGSWTDPLEDRSGAYTFVPNGPAMRVEVRNPQIGVVEGLLFSEVVTMLPLVTHKVTLYNSTGAHGVTVHIENYSDLSGNNNTELAMRVVSDIDNGETFYTDVNSFQMQKREYISKFKIQGNFYPITSQTYIEDHLFRMSLLCTSSHGATSLKSGELEVMLDRRLNQDDWRGLNQGVSDNVLSLGKFVLVWETRKKPDKFKPSSQLGHSSLLSHQMSMQTNNEPEIFIEQNQAPLSSLDSLKPLANSLPSDVHVVNLRLLSTPKDGEDHTTFLLLRRVTTDCDFANTYSTCDVYSGQLPMSTLFSSLTLKELSETSLTGLQTLGSFDTSKNDLAIHLPLMKIKAFRLLLR